MSAIANVAVTPGAGASVAGVSYTQNGGAAPVFFQEVVTGGEFTTACPASASVTVVKATPGRLCKVLVTTTGANPLQIFDNATAASGTVIASFAASPAVGTVVTFDMPAANGITLSASATNPAVTVSWI